MPISIQADIARATMAELSLTTSAIEKTISNMSRKEEHRDHSSPESSERGSLDRHKTEQDQQGDNEKRDEALQRVESEIVYPTGATLYLVMASLYLGVFLIALDRTIIATAIPSITNDFGSLGDVGWYGSAYLLTACGFQLFFGR